ncbi:MAG: PaaX family transcriptional regulator, partial [Rhodobacteraceae bacterium]
AMRVAIHRLRKDGWIDSQRHGRTSVYFLTPRGRAQTTEASPRIYATGQAAERAWVALANPGQPAPGDGMPGVWIASHVLVTAVAPVGSGLFVTKVEASTALPDWMTSRVCDDATVMMTRNFAAALAAVRPCLDPAPALGPLEVAAIRVLVVHGWRRIVLKTPVLPDHVFPPAWQGPRCRDLVSDLLDRYPRPRLEDLEAAIGGDPGK